MCTLLSTGLTITFFSMFWPFELDDEPMPLLLAILVMCDIAQYLFNKTMYVKAWSANEAQGMADDENTAAREIELGNEGLSSAQ